MADVNVPAFRVTLDGRDLTDRIAPKLVSITITEKRGGEASQLDLVIDDSAGDMAIPPEGASLRVSLGWAKVADDVDAPLGLIDKGSFKVDEAEWGGPPDTITIRARSADLTAGYRQRRERTHRQTTLGAVVRQIADANGLTAQVAASLDSIEVPVLAQDQVSDMAMIRRLGRRYDAAAQVIGEILIFAPIGAGTTARGTAIPPARLTRAAGDKYSYRRAQREQYASVEARWHDQAGATRRTVTEPVPGSGTHRGRGIRRVRRIHHSEADARHHARSEARRIQRAAASFEQGLAVGRPDLYPERPVTLVGYKPEIDAKSWIIAEVEHQLSADRGLITRLKLETRT